MVRLILLFPSVCMNAVVTTVAGFLQYAFVNICNTNVAFECYVKYDVRPEHSLRSWILKCKQALSRRPTQFTFCSGLHCIYWELSR